MTRDSAIEHAPAPRFEIVRPGESTSSGTAPSTLGDDGELSDADLEHVVGGLARVWPDLTSVVPGP